MKNAAVPFFLVLVAIALLAFVLYGCGGETFTTTMFTPVDGPDAEPLETGGAPGTGGQTATGGHSSPATGGAPKVDSGPATGGVPVATGGSPSTGGVVVATGGVPVVDACALVTHDNGLGQTWEDCVPLGTYNEAQAIKACKAYTMASCPDARCVLRTDACSTGESGSEYTGDCGEGRILWVYSTKYQSDGIGHVANTTCPTAQDPLWR